MKAQNGRFIFYHRTNTDEARLILENGFRNSSGYYLSNRIWTGVWLSSIPVDGEPAAQNETLLMVKLDLEERELSRWEWIAEGKSHREWLMPAGIVNRCATVEIVDQLDASTVAA
jgi:hypothetical protein